MTLARRISLMVGAVIAVTSLSVALLTAFSGRSTALSQVDERLLDLRETSAASDDPVDAVLHDMGVVQSDLVA